MPTGWGKGPTAPSLSIFSWDWDWAWRLSDFLTLDWDPHLSPLFSGLEFRLDDVSLPGSPVRRAGWGISGPL